jgi:hypothetical protein
LTGKQTELTVFTSMRAIHLDGDGLGGRLAPQPYGREPAVYFCLLTADEKTAPLLGREIFDHAVCASYQ